MPLFLLVLLLLPNSGFAGRNTQDQPGLTLVVPANGDDYFPLNGSMWLYGKNLDELPQEISITDGYGAEEVPPWEQNSELAELWREPRRVQWRRNSGRRRLRALTDGQVGLALIEVSSGFGVEIEVTTLGAVYRPPIRFTADGLPLERAADNVFDLLVVTPVEKLEPETEYALLANGDLSVFSTGQVDDVTAPSWGGIDTVQHIGERNTVYTLSPATDDSSFPVRVELYRGEARNPRLRQFALVNARPVRGRLSPLNEDCVFTRAVDVAGNYTEMFPCYRYPDLPEVEIEEEAMFGCNVARVLPRQTSGWVLIVIGTLLARRFAKRDMTGCDKRSLQSHVTE